MQIDNKSFNRKGRGIRKTNQRVKRINLVSKYIIRYLRHRIDNLQYIP